MTRPLLKLKNITKIYPGVVALDDVSLSVMPGEVHALVGENGAGKSTLIKAVTGAIQPTSGEIWFEGNQLEKNSPSKSIEAGISAIYQEFNLVPRMSVAENIMLGRFPLKNGLVDYKAMYTLADQTMNDLGVPIDVNTLVMDLTVGYQQLVEISKSVSRDCKLIIMDEPSAALTNRELDSLFEIVNKLKERGIAILYISHRLDEIFDISDVVTVLRDGQYIGTYKITDINRQELIQLMVNRELVDTYPHTPLTAGEVMLEVNNLCTPMLNDISFKVHRGEILGLSGLVGAGRTEVARAIFGADKFDKGTFVLNGQPYVPSTPRHAIDNGIGLVTEDRKQQGLLLHLNVRDNIVIANLRGVSNKFSVVSSAKIDKASEEYIEKLQVKTPSDKQLVSNLSGGNQQKVVLAKWLFADCDVIIFDEPTRGIDVGAKQEIYVLMDDLVKQGKAIIMISSEMPEIIGLADRILVMHEGCIMGELSRGEATQERILTLASGIQM